MRILFHAINYLPKTEADARRISGLAENLKDLGCSVDVVTVYPDKVKGKKRKFWFFQFTKTEVINDIKIYRYYTIPFHNKGTFRRLLNNLSFAISSLFHIFRFRYYDVVITSSPPLLISNSGRIIAKFKGSKLVFDIRDIWPDIAIDLGSIKEKSIIAKTFNRLAHKMYVNSDLITTVTKNKVIQLKAKVQDNDKIKLISNGVDSFFLKQEENKKFLEENKFNSFFSIIHIGKIGIAQDIDAFLDLAKVSLDKGNIRFYLLGDGVEKDRIIKRIKNENINNVKYLGHRNISEVYTALKYAQISYVSLKNENLIDSVPTKLLESLYAGCPVLLSAAGESSEILEASKFGLTSKPGDFNTLLNNFNYMYNNYQKVYSNKEFCFNYINTNYNRINITKLLFSYLKTL